MNKLPLHRSGLTKLAVRQHETGSKPLGRTALLVLKHWQECERLKAEAKKMAQKWDEQISLHKRVCDDPLMYTKEQRQKASHYAQALCAVVADLEALSKY